NRYLGHWRKRPSNHDTHRYPCCANPGQPFTGGILPTMTSPTKAEDPDTPAGPASEATPGEGDDAKGAAQLVGRSPGQLMWLRFKRDRTGVVSAWIVALFFAVAILAPVISALYGKDPYTLYGQENPELLDQFNLPTGPGGGMSAEHWFGIEPDLG